MGCLLAYEPEMVGIFGGVGVRNAYFADSSTGFPVAGLTLLPRGWPRLCPGK